MFKKIILFCSILFTLNANEHKELNFPSYKDSIESLKSIEEDGIFYGSGKRMVYVFLDPLCPYSRKFISILSKNEKMLSKYRYCIYLYGIPRLHSTGAVAAVYDSKNSLETLLSIMIDDAKLSIMTNEKINEKINEIEIVAKKLNVNKRPFLIVEK